MMECQFSILEPLHLGKSLIICPIHVVHAFTNYNARNTSVQHHACTLHHNFSLTIIPVKMDGDTNSELLFQNCATYMYKLKRQSNNDKHSTH